MTWPKRYKPKASKNQVDPGLIPEAQYTPQREP